MHPSMERDAFSLFFLACHSSLSIEQIIKTKKKWGTYFLFDTEKERPLRAHPLGTINKSSVAENALFNWLLRIFLFYTLSRLFFRAAKLHKLWMFVDPWVFPYWDPSCYNRCMFSSYYSCVFLPHVLKYGKLSNIHTIYLLFLFATCQLLFHCWNKMHNTHKLKKKRFTLPYGL